MGVAYGSTAWWLKPTAKSLTYSLGLPVFWICCTFAPNLCKIEADNIRSKSTIMKILRSIALVLACGALMGLAACQPKDGAKTPADTQTTDSTTAHTEGQMDEQVEVTEPSNPLPTVGLKIAWVDMDSLMHGYDYYFAMEKEMASLNASAEKELNEKGQSLQRRAAEFQSNVEKGLLTRSEAQKLQEELGQEQARLLQLQESKRQQLLEEEQVRLRKVTAAIQGFINRYNQNHGYNYILSVGTLYADPRLSITAEVLKGLNEEYAAEHAKNAKK